jgi:hypothetical protein
MARYSLPGITGARGAGLGNEVIPWGKAFLAAQALDLRLVDPPWWLNKRPYGRELGTSVWTTAEYCALRALPTISLDSARVQSLGPWDYFDAMLKLKADRPSALGSRPVLLHSSGMDGGYLAIRRARRFLASRLLYSRRSEALMTVGSEAAVRIGVHVRAGDFASAEKEPPGELEPGAFNVEMPPDWYLETITSLVQRLGGSVQVLVASQGPTLTVYDQRALADLRHLSGTSVQDLSVLASCDVIVPSISSYSMLAIFLSDALYVWPAQHLHDVGGWRDIWGHEPRQVSGPTARSRDIASSKELQVFRGIPRSGGEPWPDWFIDQIRIRAQLRRQEQDLTLYGVAR